MNTIFGMDTSRDEAARIMNRWIRTDWLAVEAPLYRGKWFDYRFLNPVQATYLYASEYVIAYRNAFRTNMDSERAQFIKPLDIERLFLEPAPPTRFADEIEEKWEKRLKEHIRKIKAHKLRTSGIWRGRQIADAMGMPYKVYLELAFHWALRYWQQSNLPRPQQLYSDMIVDRATIDWEARQKTEFFYSSLPQYANAAYEDAIEFINGDEKLEGTILQSQNAHHEWLLEQCKERSNGHALLAQMVFHDRILPLDKVKGRLDDHGFEHFMSFAESNPVIARYN